MYIAMHIRTGVRIYILCRYNIGIKNVIITITQCFDNISDVIRKMVIIFKPGTPGFLELLLSVNVCMCACVCLPPRLLITNGEI